MRPASICAAVASGNGWTHETSRRRRARARCKPTIPHLFLRPPCG
ncbi:hypothetical protein [Lysobacter gummosus]